MEPSESESVGSSTITRDPQLDSQCELSSHVPNHEHDPQPSESDPSGKLDLKDLSDESHELGGEIHGKLDLKNEGEGVGETEKKVSNFEAGVGESGGEVHDKFNLKNEGDGVDETEKKVSNFEAGVGELGGEFHDKLDLKGEGEGDTETEKKDSNFEAGDGELGGEGDALESGQGQVSDDGWNCDEGYGWNENVKESEFDKVSGDDDENDDGNDDDEVGKKEGTRSVRAQQYPLRPEAEDCAYYLKTGSCKFGFNCKFNHPVKRKTQAVKEKVGEREESAERSGQIECKYYLRSGGCKFGKACKFNHTRVKSSAAAPFELNFLGLPIRLGEKECPYYMRTGSCKFGANCKFNHPDPTTVGGASDSPLGYGNGSSISSQGLLQSTAPSWSSQKQLNETGHFVPMMLSSTQAVSPPSSDWNGYQAPVLHPPSAYVMNNPAIETNVYMHNQKQISNEEFPERPGEPECSYFLKTGDCKFKSNCKFHHPKNRNARLPPCNLSDKGLPLRPEQNVCTHYSRYGICKFGPSCKYDHPTNPSPSTLPELDHQSSYMNTASVEVARMGGSAGANDATIL